jgi:hypothetical protein
MKRIETERLQSYGPRKSKSSPSSREREGESPVVVHSMPTVVRDALSQPCMGSLGFMGGVHGFLDFNESHGFQLTGDQTGEGERRLRPATADSARSHDEQQRDLVGWRCGHCVERVRRLYLQLPPCAHVERYVVLDGDHCGSAERMT